jgi:hypothetical protein
MESNEEKVKSDANDKGCWVYMCKNSCHRQRKYGEGVRTYHV